MFLLPGFQLNHWDTLSGIQTVRESPVFKQRVSEILYSMNSSGIKICCCSVTQSCPTLWHPMECSTPGFPVLHHLPQLATTHVHWVSHAIQASCPLWHLLLLPSIFPSIRVFLMSRLFMSGSQSIGAFWATSSKMRGKSYATEFSQTIYTGPDNISQF